MVWLYSLAFGWLAAGAAYGQDTPRVLGIPGTTEILVTEWQGCPTHTVLGIFSQDGDQEVLGYARFTGARRSGGCVATVRTHSRSGLIRVGDRAQPLNLQGRDRNLPGRYDLVVDDERDVAARHKPLVYGGYLFGDTAATLADGEFLVGLSPLFYGVTNRLQIETFPIETIEKVASLGAKYNFLRTEDIRVSLLGMVKQHFDVGRRAWNAGIFLDSASNANSMSHTVIRFHSKNPTSGLLEDKDKTKRFSAELISTYEWVLPRWQRILLGPKFTAGDEKDLGLVFSAIFPYEHFHWTINVELNSVTRFEFRDNKQVFTLDFFWRI